MPKSRAQKEQTVGELTAQFQTMKGAVIVDYKGLKMKDAQKVRKTSWDQGVEYAVVKKTLLKLALKNAGMEGAVDVKKLQGNIGLLVGHTDEVSTAKFAATFAKEFETFKILGGFAEGKYLDASQVKALATLPGRQELLARLVGSIQSPISGFVNVMAGNLRGLVQVINAIKESKS